jgi:hypothetical protein
MLNRLTGAHATNCVVHALPDPRMLIEIEGVASLARR